MGAAGIAAGGDLGVHGGEDGGGLDDAGPGDVRVGVSAADEDGGARERAGVVEIGAGLADEAAGKGKEAGEAGGVGGDEFSGEASALGEASEGDAIGGEAGGDREIDDGVDHFEGGGEPRLVAGARGHKGVGVPGGVDGLWGEEGETWQVESLGETEDVVGGGAAPVEKDDDAGGLVEGGAGALDMRVGVRRLRDGQAALRSAL